MLFIKQINHYIYIHNQKIKMNRRWLQSFFNFHDPFIFGSSFRHPMTIRFKNVRPFEQELLAEKSKPKNPQQVFENFFNEHGIKDDKEKDFFKKYYPQKVEEKTDPYKTLELSKDASEEQIKQAYRKLAIKYHPKNDKSPEAEKKFAELAKAYEEAIEARNQKKFSDMGYKSFFQDFDKQAQQTFGIHTKDLQSGKEVKQGDKKSQRYGELYSETSHVQNLNGQQTKCVLEKKYKKDGKLLSVKRQETLKEDGNTQILETIDDGKQVKKKHYIMDKNKKQTKKIDKDKKETKKIE